jgi:hypothetical protein
VVLFIDRCTRSIATPNYREPNLTPRRRRPGPHLGTTTRGFFIFRCGMNVARNVFAIFCFGLGAALIFAANHTVDSTFSSFETALFGGIGAMILLGSYLLLRR